jgi:phospholipid/cholesterol/gamma-HCH transport system substrate-binding protein
MENRAYALAAGLFTLLLSVAAVAIIWWFSGAGQERVPYLLVSKHSVSGLSAQASVRLRGVEVGAVESVRFDPQNPHLILVRIGVDPGTPVAKDTYAQLGFQGITGLPYVRLEDGGKDYEPLVTSLQNPARIELRPSLLEQLGSSGEQLLATVTEITERLNAILSDQNMARFSRTIANIENTFGNIASVAKELEPSAKALPELLASVERTLEGVPSLIAELKTGAAAVPRFTESATKTLKRADELLANLNRLSAEITARVDVLDRVAENAERLGDAGEAASQALSGDTLPKINALVRELSAASRSVERLASEFRNQPPSFLFGKRPQPGPGEPGFSAPPGASR